MPLDEVLQEISDFCRANGIAESTFGRLAVNDGKLAARLREGRSLTTSTVDRLRQFMATYGKDKNGSHPGSLTNGSHNGNHLAQTLPRPTHVESVSGREPAAAMSPDEAEAQKNFRFFDNRQKYLLFVNTCSEKQVVSDRVALELANITPHPPAFRLFDAGVGDGTVLMRVLRAMHARYPAMPFYVMGKEISLEDVRLTLDKLADRLYEHPPTVMVLTNLYYAEAPWLAPRSPAAAQSLIWKEVALSGNSAHDFQEQIEELQPFLGEKWSAHVSEKTGNPVYDRPVVLVVYREDQRFLLDSVLPRPGRIVADYDLVIASQPYRARASTEFKAQKVISPLARSLGWGGRLIGIHSAGGDPGLEIVQKVWPGENPFHTSRHDLLKEVKRELGSAARDYNFNAYSDARSVFRYDMHTMPGEVSGPVGTSTLFAAWNAAIYVAQIEDQRLSEVVRDDHYLKATGEVLRDRGGLWFNDESFVISRHRA
jgi:hypothetical protein